MVEYRAGFDLNAPPLPGPLLHHMEEREFCPRYLVGSVKPCARQFLDPQAWGYGVGPVHIRYWYGVGPRLIPF